MIDQMGSQNVEVLEKKNKMSIPRRKQKKTISKEILTVEEFAKGAGLKEVNS
jgi:hypothetical protein